MAAEYIIIRQTENDYVGYPMIDEAEQALNGYLLSRFSLSELAHNSDDMMSLNDRGDEVIYCCTYGEITINGNTYDGSDLGYICEAEFDNDPAWMVNWLTDNGYIILDGTTFDDMFKEFMWDVVANYKNGYLNIDIDFDDLFVTIHQEYGIGVAVDCIKLLNP